MPASQLSDVTAFVAVKVVSLDSFQPVVTTVTVGGGILSSSLDEL
jgi:hypothetical protein